MNLNNHLKSNDSQHNRYLPRKQHGTKKKNIWLRQNTQTTSWGRIHPLPPTQIAIKQEKKQEKYPPRSTGSGPEWVMICLESVCARSRVLMLCRSSSLLRWKFKLVKAIFIPPYNHLPSFLPLHSSYPSAFSWKGHLAEKQNLTLSHVWFGSHECLNSHSKCLQRNNLVWMFFEAFCVVSWPQINALTYSFS